MKTSKDGDKICCTLDDFVNLQESPAGFGDTEKEAKENLLLNMFDGLELLFCSYYKYSFSFKGEKNGYEVFGYVGGSSDDIYRYEVKRDDVKILSKYTIKDFSHIYVYKMGEKSSILDIDNDR